MGTPSRYQYFTTEELSCGKTKCGCGLGPDDMDEDFMRLIVTMRRELGFPFPVTSAIRCPKHNEEVSTTGPNGPHTTGKAIDIAVNRKQAWHLLSLAMRYGIPGIGIQQKGGGRFIHLDTIQRTEGLEETVWSY